ncbi:hypothetical protein TrCOL_g842 [Triparma columacea]|uniref:TPM domain-containing protein n=1 Tax=Triparma columacea TaxID=722753 RepID=A0A9W7G0Y6_9STRA|nr:hypothetical protein TrCOL_g842 [Triparma columacea]
MGLYCPSFARPESVNRPDLLPSTKETVIVTQPRITKGQTKRLTSLISQVEEASGVRIRVLVQDYPNTPGLAIKDYWGLGSDTSGGDDKYVVLVADDFGGKGNLLNFNVSPEVDLLVSPAYFSRLSGKYGTKFYVRDKGEDIAIMDAVEDLAACLVGEEGMCSVVKGTERK